MLGRVAAGTLLGAGGGERTDVARGARARPEAGARGQPGPTRAVVVDQVELAQGGAGHRRNGRFDVDEGQRPPDREPNVVAQAGKRVELSRRDAGEAGKDGQRHPPVDLPERPETEVSRVGHLRNRCGLGRSRQRERGIDRLAGRQLPLADGEAVLADGGQRHVGATTGQTRAVVDGE